MSELSSGERSALSIWESALFLDFYWDFTDANEILALEPAVCVDVPPTGQRLVMQWIRGEVRYWACAKTEPACDELGVFASIESAIEFCRQFAVQRKDLSDIDADRRVLNR